MKAFILLLLPVLIALPAVAQWNDYPPTTGSIIGATPYADYRGYTCTDGSGGMITAWDAANAIEGTYAIYVQRTSSVGLNLWNASGEPLQLALTNTAGSGLSLADIQPDGSGGAYVSWLQFIDDTSTSLHLQHMSNTGQRLFGDSGIQVNGSNGRYVVGGRVCRSGNGLIFCWTEIEQDWIASLPTYAEVLLQRFDGNGNPLWPGAVPVSTTNALRNMAILAPDNNGGAFVAFTDSRNSGMDAGGNTDNLDIFAQHISSSGQRLWSNGAVVTTAIANQSTLDGSNGDLAPLNSIVPDSAGGFIMVYERFSEAGSHQNYFAQRLNASGARVWDTSGVVFQTTTGNGYVYFNGLVNNGSQGVVASWNQYDFDPVLFTTRLQRFAANGTLLWDANGLIAGDGIKSGENSAGFTTDESGNCIVSWVGDDYILKACKINTAGEPAWPLGTVNIATTIENIYGSPVVTPSDDNNCIVLWNDQRYYNSNNTDLFASKINGTDGSLIRTVIQYAIADGNWNDPSIWIEGFVPPPGANVVILGNVNINVDVTCNTLVVWPPGSVTVNSGVTVTVLH